MSTVSKKIVRMVYTTQDGRTFSLTLPDPKDDLTSADVEAVMDLVILKNIFATSGGDIIGKRDIKIVDTSTTDLYDPLGA